MATNRDDSFMPVLPNDEAQGPRWRRSETEDLSKTLRVIEVPCSAWLGGLCLLPVLVISGLVGLVLSLGNLSSSHALWNPRLQFFSSPEQRTTTSMTDSKARTGETLSIVKREALAL
jgi:hypothetical protein